MLKKTLAALMGASLLIAPLATASAQGRGGGSHGGGSFHGGYGGSHGGGSFHGGYGGFHGGYRGYGGYGYGGWGYGFGFGLGAALAYDSFYPGYWGYGYPAYWGSPYADYDTDEGGYADPWSYDYGSSGAPAYGAPAPSTAPAMPQASGQNCGKWVWHADENQYRFETHAC